MTLQTRFAAALTRVSTASNVARQRQAEAERAERRNDAGQLERLASVVCRFEELADEMEAALS